MTSIQIDIKDGLSSSAAIKGPCRAATTGNITLVGQQTIDGVAVVTGDRILVKSQTAASDNGIYVVDTGNWRRSKDFNKTRDVVAGTLVLVIGGAVGTGIWSVTATDPITVGTTSISFASVPLSAVQIAAIGLPNPAVAGTFLQRNAGNTAYDAKLPADVRDALDTPPYVATRTALKALDTTKDVVAILIEAGYEGIFDWRSANYATLHGLDTVGGVYIKANAIASSAGGWVRRNERVYRAEWFGAVGDGSTDDSAAINMALAVGGVGIVIDLLDKVYAAASLISVSKDGQYLRGRMGGATFSVSPTTTEGTVLKWTGASGGTLLYFGCLAGGSADMSGGGFEAIQFDGNALADKVVQIRSCSFSTFRSNKFCNARNNSAAACLWLDSDVQARAGVNCVYRCNFYNTVIVTGGAAAHGLWITGASDETSGRHPAFTSFHGLHVTHKDGDAVHIVSADDFLFADIGMSKVAGGAGHSVNLVPGINRFVVGLTFIQAHLGSNDTPDFVADQSSSGSAVHGIAIYGLQGVDMAPTITLVNGATIERIDYLGTSYDPDPAVRGAYSAMPPIKLGNYANAGSDVLDYYKERTNNPILSFGGGVVGMTNSIFARQTRVGNTVQLKIQSTLSAKGSSTGSVAITGLQYSCVDGYALSIYATNLTSGVGDTELMALTTATSIVLYKMVAGVATQLTNADLTNTSQFVISGSYHTADAAP